MQQAALKGACKANTLAQDAFYMASGLFIKVNCYNDESTIEHINGNKCQQYEDDSNTVVLQSIIEAADTLIAFNQSQSFNMSLTDLSSTVKEVVEQNDALALDDKGDRETLINHLIANLSESKKPHSQKISNEACQLAFMAKEIPYLEWDINLKKSKNASPFEINKLKNNLFFYKKAKVLLECGKSIEEVKKILNCSGENSNSQVLTLNVN
jgi:hypothetical protein